MTEKDILSRTGFPTLNSMQHAMLETPHRRIALLAPTGSGKTVAFIIFLLRHIKAGASNHPSVLIVVPTRELAQQIAGVMKSVAPEYRTTTLYGGRRVADEVNIIKGVKPEVVIATPGRLLDHMSRGNIVTNGISTLILDEMDKCLELGFLPDIKKILKRLPQINNIILSSATMPTDPELLEKLGRNEVMDFRNAEEDIPKLQIIEVPSVVKDKIETLTTLLHNIPAEDKTIVFVNHRESARRIYDSLHKQGFPVGIYTGDLEQQQREIALFAFESGVTPILISTDLGSRGLDIENVDNIIHYHLPSTAEIYTHRNGRTARAGSSGTIYVIRHDEENFPEFINPDRQWYPQANISEVANKLEKRCVIINIGRKDKISKTDILGFLTKQLNIPAAQVGKIMVADYYSAFVLPRQYCRLLFNSAETLKIKNHRFKPSTLE